MRVEITLKEKDERGNYIIFVRDNVVEYSTPELSDDWFMIKSKHCVEYYAVSDILSIHIDS